MPEVERGDYAYIEDGPRGDDEGLVLRVKEFTVVIASSVHHDCIAYDRRLVAA